MSRGTILGLALLAVTGLGLAQGIEGTPAESSEALWVYGRVAPPVWQDALGVYSEVWPVEITVCYGEEIYDRWSGKANAQGCFEAELRRLAGREDARVAVKITGGLVYHDAQAQAEPGLEPAADVGVLRMQRKF